MDLIDLSQANELARAFHGAVVTHWPEFAAFARLNESGELVFEVSRNLADNEGDRVCLVATADEDLDETIIAFGGGHSHGGDWRCPTGPDFRFQGSIRLIEDIIAERVIGYSTEAGGGGLGSHQQMASLENVTDVRSWRGTYDLGS